MNRLHFLWGLLWVLCLAGIGLVLLAGLHDHPAASGATPAAAFVSSPSQSAPALGSTALIIGPLLFLIRVGLIVFFA